MQAALCALRVIKKVPDLTDHFIAKAKNILADRNHGVLLTAITLVIDMVQAEPSCLEEFRNVYCAFTLAFKQNAYSYHR
jgi:AP-1 complex subunit gamma-1